ncbi:MAG: DNA translocase FtsK [Bacteroidetes bacterium]|nr:MAG: DNA translocase FtsK [Bacteroidota bacterium]
MRKVLGWTLVFLSLISLVACLSYFFTGPADQSEADAGIDRAREVSNWLGFVGAKLASWIIERGFGIFGFIPVVYTLIIGLVLLENDYYVYIRRMLKYVLFIVLFGSVFFAYIERLIGQGSYDLGGGIGHALNFRMVGLVGDVGIAFLLLFALILFIVINFKAELRASQLVETLRNTRLPHIPRPAPPVSKNKAAKNKASLAGMIRKESKAEGGEAPEKETTQGTPETGLAVRPVKPVPPKAEQGAEIELDLSSGSSESQKGDQGPDLELTIVETKDEPVIEIPDRKQLEQIGDDNIGRDEEGNIEKIVPESDQEIENADEIFDLEHYDPTKELSDYERPPFELLEDHGSGRSREVDREELESNKNKIVKTLEDYGISITSIKATIGPTVTLYEIVPAAGVRISKIRNLEDDIALSLAALGIRIIAPIPGKGTIGIEVPNSKRETVSLRGVLTTEKFLNAKGELPIAIGRTISNEVFIGDLNKMPHLLIAGATGQGKSVGLNTIIASLLYKKHPAEIKFVLIDPKKVEMSLFQALKQHFIAQLPDQDEPIITDVQDAVRVLKSLCVEMDQRYDLLKKARVRNLKEYNQKFVNRKLNPRKGHHFMPYIVLVIDELADMMMTAGKEVEMPIARLAQLARAVGIHLCVATQRPSVNVITGIIKANFPARMSYRVISKVDSRTILDANGADQLIGRGDLLLSTGSELIRIQSAFIDTPEVERVVDFIAQQRGFTEPYYLPELPTDGDDDLEEDEPFEQDSRFEEAARLIVRYQIGSASLIQRKMKLGYNRAGRIIDQLERAKIVGPYSGSKARDVLVTDEAELERYLSNL